MTNKPKILAVVPARGGSKGLPGKNIKLFFGKPLIYWTIEQAQNSKYIDDIIVSTDCAEIKTAVNKIGDFIPFMRPANLANDTASMVDVILDVLDRAPGYDYIVVLQPTSPLRTTDNIDEVVKMIIDKQAESCVSICETDKSPYWMYSVDGHNLLQPVLDAKFISCRQNLPKTYQLNGAIYLFKADAFLKEKKFVTDATHAYIMPKHLSIDIDDADDFMRAESLIKIIVGAKDDKIPK